jgi:AcrR family transcriptional regulator
MRHEPQQARSIESTERMLSAAVQLLREGGADAVNVDAVIARAGTSTGAFYARFGNRRGLLEALHERFLADFGLEVDEVMRRAGSACSPHEVLQILIGGLLDHVRTHRDSFAFYVLVNAHDPAMRAQGNAATQTITKALNDLLSAHLPECAPHRIAKVSDFTARTVMAFSLEIMLFDDHEATGTPLTPVALNHEIVAAVQAYFDVTTTLDQALPDTDRKQQHRPRTREITERT